MRLVTPFDPIEIGEVDFFCFDFTQDVGAATIQSTSWTAQLGAYGAASDPAPQSRVLSATAQTVISVRAPNGALQNQTGFFSVASIGGMPPSAAGATYILEATANLSDGRILKLNSTVLCKLPGP